jgi:hypothetical protein
MSAASLTFPQRRALGELSRSSVVSRSARSIFTRSDVLWRLEERGLVARNAHDQWHITPKGQEQYEAAMAALRVAQ